MPPAHQRLHLTRLQLTVNRVDLTLAAMTRNGHGRPIVFLHGFGSTKEDYADVIHQAALSDRPILAYDAPGCGASACSDLSAIDIPFLVDVADATLGAFGINAPFDLVGHSMGGLTALLLADRYPERVTAFIDIEGNLASEDCFLSRQLLAHPHDDPDVFLQRFIDRIWESRYAGSALYAASIAHKVRAGAIAPIFTSMVELSDRGDLLSKFLALPARTMLMYGEQNNSLSYLPTLRTKGVYLAEIPSCGHFPMYSNAPAMWNHITDFLCAHR